MRLFKYMSILRKTCVFFCAVLCVLSSLYAQTPEKSNSDSRVSAVLNDAEKTHLERVLPGLTKSAADALDVGMSSLSEAMALRVFEDASADTNLKEQALQILINACISQGKFEMAERYLSLVRKKSDFDSVREALILTGTGKAELAEAILQNLSEKENDQDFNSWLNMAKGYTNYSKGEYAEAISYFEKVKKLSVNGYLAADAEIAASACKISKKTTPAENAKLEAELEKNVDLFLGTPQGFQLAKQYAGLLFKEGKLQKALEVINSQLEIELSDSVDKDDLRLIGAAINPDISKRIQELKNIMATSSSIGVLDFALALYVRDTKESADEQMEFLKKLAVEGSPSIRDRILLEISKNSVKTKNYKQAEESAKEILEDYPASSYKSYAFRILAWTAFNGDKTKLPQYRLAANYLESLADLEKDQTKAAKIRMLAADCYFMNKDYAGAEKIYGRLIEENLGERPVLINHLLDALLLQNKDEDAIKLVSTLQSREGIDENTLWDCAWKILSALRKNSGDSETLQNIEKVLENNKSLSPAMRIKILWLRARITEENGNLKRVITICEQLEREISKIEAADKPDIRLIRANAMLMRARAYEKSGTLEGEKSAFSVYTNLREKFPDTDSAQISVLYQAADLAMLERYNAARELCLSLVDKYPKSKYVYSAIFDAAEYSRKMGMESNYRTAISLLERLCKEFPDNPRNFYARLSQAEILRLINAFADARSLYTDIINLHSNHPEIYLAWLGLGDSTLALPARKKDAVAIFERLYSLPSLEAAAKAEAAYKWAFALASFDKISEANEVRFVTSLELLKNKNLTAEAKYWIGRSLFDMGHSLEAKGQLRDARAAYELIVKNNLPSSKVAKEKLGAKKKD